MKSMNDLVAEIHDWAQRKGWWDKPRDPLTLHMLMVTEIAEATEAVRNGESSFYFDANGKPEGEAVELVDCLIRIFDYFGYRGWDIEKIIESKQAYNETRPYRHGGKTE